MILEDVLGAVQALAAPTFLSAGTGGQEKPLSGTMQVPYPATVAAGNFLLLQVYASDSGQGPSVTTPSGWTLIKNQTGATPGAMHASYKIATGSESGNLDVTVSAADAFAAGRIYRFSGGLSFEAAGSAITTASATAMTCVDLTTLGAQRLAVQLFGATVNTTIGNISGETNADYTEAVAEYADTGPVTLSCQIATIAAAIAISGGSATLGAAGTDRVRIGFAITPP